MKLIFTGMLRTASRWEGMPHLPLYAWNYITNYDSARVVEFALWRMEGGADTPLDTILRAAERLGDDMESIVV